MSSLTLLRTERHTVKTTEHYTQDALFRLLHGPSNRLHCWHFARRSKRSPEPLHRGHSAKLALFCGYQVSGYSFLPKCKDTHLTWFASAVFWYGSGTLLRAKVCLEWIPHTRAGTLTRSWDGRRTIAVFTLMKAFMLRTTLRSPLLTCDEQTWTSTKVALISHCLRSIAIKCTIQMQIETWRRHGLEGEADGMFGPIRPDSWGVFSATPSSSESPPSQPNVVGALFVFDPAAFTS